MVECEHGKEIHPICLECLDKEDVSNSASAPGYICPICEATDYWPKVKHNGISGARGNNEVLFYVCGGCAAIFEDAKKFSKNRKQI